MDGVFWDAQLHEAASLISRMKKKNKVLKMHLKWDL